MFGEFKGLFEQTLRKREGLADVFTGLWDGQMRREIAQGMGLGMERVRGLEAGPTPAGEVRRPSTGRAVAKMLLAGHRHSGPYGKTVCAGLPLALWKRPNPETS